jgi:hypothetical protein
MLAHPGDYESEIEGLGGTRRLKDRASNSESPSFPTTMAQPVWSSFVGFKPVRGQ